MRATAYKVEKVNADQNANVLTELITAKIAALDDAEGVRFGQVPYWELDSSFLVKEEIVFIFCRWEHEVADNR